MAEWQSLVRGTDEGASRRRRRIIAGAVVFACAIIFGESQAALAMTVGLDSRTQTTAQGAHGVLAALEGAAAAPYGTALVAGCSVDMVVGGLAEWLF